LPNDSEAIACCPEEKIKRSSAIKKAFSDPETRARLVVAQKRGNADPAVKARKSEIMKQRMADPEYRRKVIERMLKARGIEYVVAPEAVTIS